MKKEFVLSVFIFVFAVFAGCSFPDTGHQGNPDQSNTTESTVHSSQDPVHDPSEDDEPTQAVGPDEVEIVISFLGDCTLGQHRGTENDPFGFSQVIGEDFAYPFKNAVDILSQDHLTLANLEGPLTHATEYMDQEFVFKGSPEYVEILVLGSVEAVNLANNHTYDYWDEGLNETRQTLDEAGILWSDNINYAIYEVEGVKIGMAGFNFPWDTQPIFDAIDSLRASGCHIVIISVHTGVEGTYEPEPLAMQLARDTIDYGADIYVSHHPHRLQPIEYYNGRYILYSLANFTFGGQTWLSDPDTAIIQGLFNVDLDTGAVTSYGLNVIPFSMTTVPGNDFCPMPYEPESEEYYRVMDKLRWSQCPE